MATIKSDWLGITRSTTYTMTETTTGEALKSFSGVYDRAVVSPQLSTNDLVFDSKYVIFSFPLSRPWGELSWYLDSRITIVIQGRDCNNNDVVKRMCNLSATGDRLICEWSKYFGIIRMAVQASSLREFNYITYVGAVMTRKDNTSATGCIYKIGSKKLLLGKTIALDESFVSTLCSGVSGSVSGIYDSNNNPITHSIDYISILKGADENPQSSRKYIANGVAFAPAGSDGGCYFYQVKGINKNKTNHKNSRYYYNAAFFTYDTLKIGGEYVYPSRIWIDNVEQQNITTRQSIVDIVGTAEYDPEVKMLYGGYYYQLSETYKSTYSSLLHYKNFGQFSTETEFFTYFGFSGDRYRTKFSKYNNHNSLELYSQYVNGTLTVKYAANSPFESNSTGVVVTNTNSKVTFAIVDNNLSKTNSNYISNFFPVSITLKNRFTGNDEPNYVISIPLYDENLYYIFGDMLRIETSAIAANKLANFNATLSDQKEIVLYSDMTLPDQTFKDTKILNMSTESLINTVKTWRILNSKTPITNPEKPESTSGSLEGSYFSYYFPHIEFGAIDITNDIKFYNDLEYYSILKCKPFLKQTASAVSTNIVSDLKLQDGKLFYKLAAQGFGDYNDKFSINQFINYGIDGKHPIGLSSFDTNKCLGIYVPKTITNGMITEWELKYTKQTEANEDSTATLKLFYTDTLHSFEIPNFDLSKVGAGGLPLRLRYYDKELDYTIFEANIGVAVVVAGTRPLGLRKQGVIVNPLLPNEQLPNGTAERINLKANITTETTETEPEVKIVKASGNVIEMIVCDDNGTILEDKNKNDIKCTIEYRGTQKEEGEGDQKKIFYEGGFYFDGVNLQQVTKNANDIIDIIEGINNATYDSKRGDSSSTYKCYQAVFSSQLQKNVTKTGTITVSNVPANAKYTYIIDTHIIDGVASYLSDGNISASLDTTRDVAVSGTTHTVPYTCKYDETNDVNNWCEFQVRCYVFSHKITI